MNKLERQALHMEWFKEYLSGMTMTEIAAVHGVTHPAVSQAIAKLREQLDEEVIADARALDLNRIDALIDRQWPDAVKKGKPVPTRLIRDLIRLRARILGYEAPARVQHSGRIEHDVAPELAAILTKVQERNQAIRGELTRVEPVEEAAKTEEAEVVEPDDEQLP